MTTYHEAQLRPEEATALIRYALNDLRRQGVCCPQCCRYCSVLHALLVSGRLDALLRYPEPEEAWWDAQRHCVDRDFLIPAWKMTECHAD